ncbi:MAG: hypothetical protein U1F67_20405 [Rubrivivax sp.]
MALAFERECRRSSGGQFRHRALDGQLDVLRRVVLAADDDQVLQPAGYEQLAALQHACMSPLRQERRRATLLAAEPVVKDPSVLSGRRQ